MGFFFFSWNMFWAVMFLFLVGLFLGRCLRPGLLRARYTRLLLRKEPSPSYPYRIFLFCWNLIWAMHFQVWFIFIWARPFGSGFYGFRCASEHPADGSPLGPANPSRNFVFRLKYFFLGDAFGPGYSGLAAARFLLRKEPSPAYPYRGLHNTVKFWNRHRYFWR